MPVHDFEQRVHELDERAANQRKAEQLVKLHRELRLLTQGNLYVESAKVLALLDGQ